MIYIKVITGYGDNFQRIPLNEAHKAYYLFYNPEERGVFNNGTAIVGKFIMEIEPDIQSVLGYNRGYKLEAQDYGDYEQKRDWIEQVLSTAKEIAKKGDKAELNKPLKELVDIKKLLDKKLLK